MKGLRSFSIGVAAVALILVLGQIASAALVENVTTFGGNPLIYWTGTGAGSVILPAGVTSIKLLVVAGGGAGGVEPNTGRGSAGGGAGGLLYSAAYAVVPNTIYPLTVGAGGAAAFLSGENSTFGSLTAIGGGGGGGVQNGGDPNPDWNTSKTLPGKNGGSGGGAAWTYSPGSGTPGQGYGGNGPTGNNGGGAGGGAGGPANSITGWYPWRNDEGGGNGGVGLDLSADFGTSIGDSGWFAGGGGGRGPEGWGLGGRGGGGYYGTWYWLDGVVGGTLITNPSKVNGTDGTGGGGGAGAFGGSGIVALTYTYTAPPVVPEPAGLGLIGLALLAIRKRRS